MATTAVISGIGVVVAIAILVLASSSLVRSGRDEVIRDIQSLDAVERLEGKLLDYADLSNIHVVDPSAGTDALREEARRGIERLEATLEELSGSPKESEAVAQARDDIARYFEARAVAEAEEEALRHVVARTRDELDVARESVEELRQINQRQLDTSNARDRMLGRLSALAGAGAVAVVLAGVVGFLVFLRRELIRPLVGLTRAASSFRAGHLEARAPESGPKEVRDVARALNEAGAALEEQRRTRLTFVAAVAHDLRTPLQALKTSIELLREEPGLRERPHAQKLVDQIERQSGRLLLMANDLGEASQIEAGELTLSLQPTDLRDSVRAMVELYRPTSEIHEVEFVEPDEPIMVHADGVRIEQVVGNLLSNAIKYSPDGGKVRVEVASHDGRAELRVADEGVGIDPDTAAELFLPFRRGKQSVHRLAGSGLGLSVSKRIVTAHGGEIDVAPNEGRGSTFRVTLPLLSDAAIRERPRASA